MGVKKKFSIVTVMVLVASVLLVNSHNNNIPCYMKQCPDGLNLCYSLFNTSKVMIFNGSTTCGVLYFQQTKYNLTKSIVIVNCSKIRIVGNNTLINCSNSPSLVFRNVGMLEINNIRLSNCGGILKSLKISVHSCFIFHNVSLLKVSKVSFLHNTGLAMHGAGLHIVSILNTYGQNQCGNGGIMLTFSNTTEDDANNNAIPYVTFDHCNFQGGLCNVETNSYQTSIPALLGLIFHQPKHLVYISNTKFVNIRYNNRQLVLISFQTIMNKLVNKLVSKPINVIIFRCAFISNNNIDSLIRIDGNFLNIVTSVTDCKFISNSLSDLRFENTRGLMLKGKNQFMDNHANIQIFLTKNTSCILQGKTKFRNNNVGVLLFLDKYLTLGVSSSLTITNNKARNYYCRVRMVRYVPYVIHTSQDNTDPELCAFQVPLGIKSHARVHFYNNTGFHRLIYGYPFSSCKWSHSSGSNPGTVLDNIIKYDVGSSGSVAGRENCVCLCYSNRSDCFSNKIDAKIYPGQMLTLPVISRDFSLSMFIDSSAKVSHHNTSVCESASFHQLNFVYQRCTTISYTIKSNSTKWCSLYLRTATKDDTLYIYNVTLLKCPLGLIHTEGLCVCDPRLEAKGLKCNTHDGTFKTPPYTWISEVKNMTEIMYSVECYTDYCLGASTTNVHAKKSNYLCSNNRNGVICGECSKGYSAVFGSSHCKKCTHFWLFLIPAYAMGGILIVVALFTLNLTVVDGDIYGFLLYVNVLSIYGWRIFPHNSQLSYFPLLMANLDLGIEVCFYDGMTSYVTIWLQFIFPFYVILIVVVLSFSSRYFTTIEKLTRKRVIPVIATLYILAFNKMMLVAAKGLFAYRIVHYLNSESTKMYWAVDTSIPLFGLKFILLFIFCLLVLVFVLIPTIILLLFPKPLLRYKFVATILKPFLDAYQAPFKDNCYYFLGIELLLRVIVYGCDSLHARYTAALYVVIILVYLTYLSFARPFKRTLNAALYSMYICNIASISTLCLYYSPKRPKAYIIIFNLLMFSCMLQFLGTVLHHIYKYVLQKNLDSFCLKYFGRYKILIRRSFSKPPTNTAPIEMASYEEFRDELLALDPNN